MAGSHRNQNHARSEADSARCRRGGIGRHMTLAVSWRGTASQNTAGDKYICRPMTVAIGDNA